MTHHQFFSQPKQNASEQLIIWILAFLILKKYSYIFFSTNFGKYTGLPQKVYFNSFCFNNFPQFQQILITYLGCTTLHNYLFL